MPQFAFILTGDKLERSDRYVAAFCLAALSAKHFHPDIPIACLGDERCKELYEDNGSPLARLVDQFISCPGIRGGPVHRSRAIKTTLRQRLGGPFVYLDTDTVLVGDLQPLLDCKSTIGLTADNWFTDGSGTFPSWCAPIYRDLGWKYPAARYYNGGVMFASDSPPAHALFDEWAHRYAQSVARGINRDQPSLNSALQHVAPQVEEYPEDYNFLCAPSPRPIPASARLLHVCCSLATTRIPAYEGALRALQGGAGISIADLAIHLKTSSAQTPKPWRLLLEFRRRSYEFVERKLCRMKWVSAERH